MGDRRQAYLKREDFSFDPHLLRGSALAAGYTELALQGEHVLAVDEYPASVRRV